MKCWIHCVLMVYLVIACDRPANDTMESDKTALTDAEIEKIYTAIPAAPTIQPQKLRKLLVFSLSWGYKHDAIIWGKKTFELMAKKTKAFNVIISDDVAMFEPENLRQFDAVLFNNTNREIFLPENFDQLSSEVQLEAKQRDELLKNSLVNFLTNGKGLAVIHAGVASFREWPEYGNIIGARFDNHPWNAGSTVTLKVEDLDHPLNRAFPQKYYKVTDEIYQFTGNYSRDKLRVLLSIDTSQTDMTVENIHRKDGDFAISWIKNYGEGRIFYCALGHEKHIFWDPILLRHFLDGLQFVLGDLPCDTTPSVNLKY
jgi:type 1 glutamine amidotransferase